jgi:hypothetical protein
MQFPTCKKGGSKPMKRESKHARGRQVLMMKNGFNIVKESKGQDARGGSCK